MKLFLDAAFEQNLLNGRVCFTSPAKSACGWGAERCDGNDAPKMTWKL
jgi:hypothetical protein